MHEVLRLAQMPGGFTVLKSDPRFRFVRALRKQNRVVVQDRGRFVQFRASRAFDG